MAPGQTVETQQGSACLPEAAGLGNRRHPQEYANQGLADCPPATAPIQPRTRDPAFSARQIRAHAPTGWPTVISSLRISQLWLRLIELEFKLLLFRIALSQMT